VNLIPDYLLRNAGGWISTDIAYVALLFVLFVAPKFLQRYRVPSAVTALIFGAVAGMGFGVLRDDSTVTLLSTLGIVSLFLFAGLDVNLKDLQKEWVVFVETIVVTGAGLAGAVWAAGRIFDLSWRPAALVALALLTPSTGFILDSLGGWGLTEREQFWVRGKAIALELVALVLMFVVVQSTSAGRLGASALAVIAMIALLPIVFRWFARVVVPWAPKSEFGFLMMVAVASAIATRALGVYYLVGAFAVGMAAQQFRGRLPAIASERMVQTVEGFGSLFVPFYFFHAGAALTAEDFGWRGALIGAAFVAIVLPVRVLLVTLYRRLRLKEPFAESIRVAAPLLPTTVFTLVLAEILRDRFDVPAPIFAGLVLYAIADTLVPGLLFRMPTPSFEDELLITPTEES